MQGSLASGTTVPTMQLPIAAMPMRYRCSLRHVCDNGNPTMSVIPTNAPSRHSHQGGLVVIPTKMGIQWKTQRMKRRKWIPVSTGMTRCAGMMGGGDDEMRGRDGETGRMAKWIPASAGMTISARRKTQDARRKTQDSGLRTQDSGLRTQPPSPPTYHPFTSFTSRC